MIVSGESRVADDAAGGATISPSRRRRCSRRSPRPGTRRSRGARDRSRRPARAPLLGCSLGGAPFSVASPPDPPAISLCGTRRLGGKCA